MTLGWGFERRMRLRWWRIFVQTTRAPRPSAVWFMLSAQPADFPFLSCRTSLQEKADAEQGQNPKTFPDLASRCRRSPPPPPHPAVGPTQSQRWVAGMRTPGRGPSWRRAGSRAPGATKSGEGSQGLLTQVGRRLQRQGSSPGPRPPRWRPSWPRGWGGTNSPHQGRPRPPGRGGWVGAVTGEGARGRKAWRGWGWTGRGRLPSEGFTKRAHQPRAVVGRIVSHHCQGASSVPR